MSNMLKVRPKKGVQVRKEDGSVMPDKICEVPNNSYYRRRLRDGDLEAATRNTQKTGDK
ncbi:MAG: DUF2635 domain-containing protein [Neptuniibacter sp.]